jgi:hypothetical protein
MLLQQPSRAISVPPRTGQLPPGDHRRPRETETGNIVRRSVERSFAWMARCRRFARDHERLPDTLAGLHLVAFAIPMLRRAGDLALVHNCLKEDRIGSILAFSAKTHDWGSRLVHNHTAQDPH